MPATKTVAEIEKKYGKGAIIQANDNFFVEGVQRISTGILSLDWALSGGYPRGRVVEIYGPESSGKTTLALHAIAEAQLELPELGVAFVDAEHALDPVYAEAIGVNMDNVLISQPDSGEQALGIVELLAAGGEISMIIVDSVAALTPEAEIKGDMGDAHVGLQARLMSQALRKLNGVVSRTDTTLIFINQLREKIGVMWGSPETTPGGRALKFYSSVRLDVRRKEQIKTGAEITGNLTTINVVKNKVGPPFRKIEVDVVYGRGVAAEGVVLDMAVDYGILVKSGGGWYADLEGEKLGQGRENIKQFLLDNPEYLEDLKTKVKEAMYAPVS